MRRSATLGILAICILVFLSLGEAVRAERIVGEKGRELLGPDGRTLVDKKHGYSIVLPASDWKVYLWEYEPYEGDAGFNLLIARPDGEVRLRIHEKVYPLPVSLENLQKVLSQPSPQTSSPRSEIIKAAGMKCLEHEGQTLGNRGRTKLHVLGMLCDRSLLRKFSVQIYPDVPEDQWPAEEKVLRELVRSFRALR